MGSIAEKVKQVLFVVADLIKNAWPHRTFDPYRVSTPIGYFISRLIKYLNRASSPVRKGPTLPSVHKRKSWHKARLSFVDPTGLEPATPSLQMRCSTR